MKRFTDSVDEIVAFIMAMGGVAILLFGTYAIFCMNCEIAVEELLLIATVLLSSSTGYLFGKSTPKKGESEIKDILMQNMQKPR